MVTVTEIVDSRRKLQKKPDDSELRQLPYKRAFIYGRVSTPGQVRDSHESIREIARLVDLAIADGFKTGITAREVEEWLLAVTKAPSLKAVREDGEVTIDIRDLGLSGQLQSEKRQGLANLQRQVEEGLIGAVYLTEGVSRLSRDQDRILPYQLLRLLKENSCRIRTPEGVWNPAVERDWEYLADEFEDAIGELKVMNKRMNRRRAQKAGRGEFAGEPVPAGFMLPVTGRKPNGEYEYGKIVPYPPHAEIVRSSLEEFIRQGGSALKTIHALGETTLPFFPAELSYMERLTSLRGCRRDSSGYRLTTNMIKGFATNLKLIGVWQWGNNEIIRDNHPAAVPQDLFLEAYQLATRPGKPKGRAVNFAPLEWSGLLQCLNHPEPRHISSHNADQRYICNRDYMQGQGGSCLDINARFLEEPLTATVLSHLDLTPFAEEVLAKLEEDAGNHRLEGIRNKHQVNKLEEEVTKWKSLLPGCVDEVTRQVDRQKEDYYWEQIREAQKKLAEITSAPAVKHELGAADYQKVRELLKSLPRNWQTYSSALRNRFLKLLIDRVEVRGKTDIEATIVWKTGLKQSLIIHRPGTKKTGWTEEDDCLLREIYPASSREAILAALKPRGWISISQRAFRLGLKRQQRTREVSKWQRWTDKEDKELRHGYQSGIPVNEMAEKLDRTIGSVQIRVYNLGLTPKTRLKSKKRARWEVNNINPLQEECSRGD